MLIQKILLFIQSITVIAFFFSAILQFAVGNKSLGIINACFFIANYIIFFGK